MSEASERETFEVWASPRYFRHDAELAWEGWQERARRAPTSEPAPVAAEITKLLGSSAPNDDAKDAARYRWLREQNWYSGAFCVVQNPKESVKLGYACPTGTHLDAVIDAAMPAEPEQP